MVAKVLAEENTIFAYQKKKGLVAEKRLVKEQREEAKEYEAKQGQLVCLNGLSGEEIDTTFSIRRTISKLSITCGNCSRFRKKSRHIKRNRKVLKKTWLRSVQKRKQC